MRGKSQVLCSLLHSTCQQKRKLWHYNASETISFDKFFSQHSGGKYEHLLTSPASVLFPLPRLFRWKTSEKPRPGGPPHWGTWCLFFPVFCVKGNSGKQSTFPALPAFRYIRKNPGIPSILPATRAADREWNVVKCSSHVTVTEAEERPPGRTGRRSVMLFLGWYGIVGEFNDWRFSLFYFFNVCDIIRLCPIRILLLAIYKNIM